MRKIRNRNLFRREWFLFFSASNEQSALPAAVVLYIYQEYLIVDKDRVLHRDGIEYQNEKM